MRESPLILIVDDNPANVEILQMRLMANNYDVITATDGEMGLTMAREKLPDLILLDIMMPKMDGFEVCRQLRGDPTLPFMPIILVTAKTESKDVVAGLEAGGDEYLTKPVDHAALVARVKSMLRIKSLHDTVLEQSTELKKQLKTATKIQTLFWPEIPELEAGGHIWAVSIPASYVGGDLYDVIKLPDGSLLAYVADVSDKGVPAALIMAALSSKIRSESRIHNDIGQLLSSINSSMYNLISEEGYFATIVIVRYWPKSGKMQIALGGHLQPLWIVKDGLGDMPELNGVSLGITANANYEKKELTLSPGESILLYSDGLIEAENEEQELFGNERLIRFAKDKKDRHIGEGLLDEIRKWRGNAIINDDLTMLEIWRD
ncbi:MAG: SpoIIE family protein phosphatase [Desulfobacteraceae bacterium]|jgi:serine phosphatase RsbU (regulator of sigma subunit)